jgi:hypothetical protein
MKHELNLQFSSADTEASVAVEMPRCTDREGESDEVEEGSIGQCGAMLCKAVAGGRHEQYGPGAAERARTFSSGTSVCQQTYTKTK